MAKCDVCGNDYDKAFTVTAGGGRAPSTPSSAPSTPWRLVCPLRLQGHRPRAEQGARSNGTALCVSFSQPL